ncbi:hypothetical protein B7R21_17935 [Subtercola boreus]|uniref:Uncharacterized protein n=1 Tax=Subtercola boreus TaxID=120213 RepID=A0A3E0VAJ4_9MICO|nr:hypothetical protein [Subtercola boreus]RFA06882.1 hypothetical protein B7R21_17935 [Subtercola boreus]
MEPLTAEMLAHLLRGRNEFVTRYQQAHPTIDQTDALIAAFSAAGHAEEFVGKKTDDEELTAQGQQDQAMGEARKNVEDVKDDLGK